MSATRRDPANNDSGMTTPATTPLITHRGPTLRRQLRAALVLLLIVVGILGSAWGAYRVTVGRPRLEGVRHHDFGLGTLVNGRAEFGYTFVLTNTGSSTIEIENIRTCDVVIFAGGTGNPFVTTDTGAALRAAEVRADILLKATKVDGVYTADPATDPTATRIDRLTYNEVIDKRLKIMDLAAVDLCQRSKIPIVVLNLRRPGHMRAVVQGERVGTLIDDGSSH